MDKRFLMGEPSVRLDWRDYQTRLNRIAAARRRTRRMYRLAGTITVLLVIGFWILEGPSGLTSVSSHLQVPEKIQVIKPSVTEIEKLLDKKDVQAFLNGNTLVNLTRQSFDTHMEGRSYRVVTTLDMPLQQFMIKNLNTSNARHIGIVAIEPSTGRILSMVGFDRANPSNNPCLDSIFPAASIFKIITAAAAVEKCGLNQGSSLSFTGGKHTLYKSQLTDKYSKYAQNITLKDSFAQSVNPVFGKIGSQLLGKAAIEQYAAAFGFNRPIDFEAPIDSSTLSVEDAPYHLAEIASGYNRTTTISPLHGALIGASILNRGAMIEPTMIDNIADQTGHVLYQSRVEPMKQVISPKSSEIMARMMEATVDSGTGRKAFKGYQKDGILSRLDIGGKTGSMDNQTHEAHFDWFVGFAADKASGQKVVVSVVVAHEKYIGTRSGYYARILMKQYFSQFFASAEHKLKQKDRG
ncbi:MAG: penicillin-binding transpeptidase domain-containing protein [Desulfatirhabdiaceae bacterium]|nr:penicillin-binding transpeptidase domain-containing protein [Desulfatirhabdiaceae bacterium]